MSTNPLVSVRTVNKRAAPTQASSSPGLNKRRKANTATVETSQDYSDARIAIATARGEAATGGTPYLSTRSNNGRLDSVPTLVSATLRQASSSARQLYANRSGDGLKPDVQYEKELLHLLPAHIASRLFQSTLEALAFDTEALKDDENEQWKTHQDQNTSKQAASTLLAEVIRLFLHSSTASFVLPAAIAHNFQLTTQIQRDLMSCHSLTTLDLTGQKHIKDNTMANIIGHLPQLQELILRSCTLAGDQSVIKAATTSPHLRIVNLNYTAVTASGLSTLLSSSPALTTLKLANVNNLNDQTIDRILTHANQTASFIPLAKLESLKLRSTQISDVGIGRILSLTPNLTTLDISFTQTRTLDFLTLSSRPLTKLLLSGLTLKRNSLIKFFKSLPCSLKVLKIASMGQRTNTKFSGEADQVDSIVVKALTNALKNVQLDTLSLGSNPKLMNHIGNIRGLLSVARGCKVLDLSNSINTASKHARMDRDVLEGLLDESDGSESRLEVLVLDGTRCEDDCAEVIAQLGNLQSLHLRNSRLTGQYSLNTSRLN